MSKFSGTLAVGWLALSPLIFLWMLYAAAFNAWLTATPLPPGGLEQAQTRTYCYFAAAIATCALSVLVLVRFRTMKKLEASGA